MDLDNLFRKYVNMSYDELKEVASSNLVEILPRLSEIVGQDNAIKTLIIIISSCTTADGVLTVKEKEFLQDLLAIEPDRAKDLVKEAHDYKFTDDVIDSMSNELRDRVLTLCLCFFAVDEKISKEEISLMIKLVKR